MYYIKTISKQLMKPTKEQRGYSPHRRSFSKNIPHLETQPTETDYIIRCSYSDCQDEPIQSTNGVNWLCFKHQIDSEA